MMNHLLITSFLATTCFVKADDGGCSPTGMQPMDYSQALCMSFIFYEDQRSGKLTGSERNDWRGDSALDDGQDNGNDLSGGYYDAGDFVKFGFPLAFAVTTLSWGMIDHSNGYEKAGQTDYGRAAIKWATDYILKTHTGEMELWGQVGDGNIDHAYWGRPEDMTMERPSWKIDPNCPGSDLAGETAAALAAASIVFSQVDPSYSSELLGVAVEMFNLADQYRGNYDQCITAAQGFYNTWGGYGDELAWSAIWLYRATLDQQYMDRAKEFIDEFGIMNYAETFYWDSKEPGVIAMMALMDGSSTYTDRLQQYVDHIMYDYQKTPQGLTFVNTWGSLRYAAGVAFISMQAANMGINTDTYTAYAQSQADYILGSTGRSFVVGFGNNPPTHAHHRPSSCPYEPTPCDYSYETTSDPNPHTLFGAVVGGPDQNDFYNDNRTNYAHNEVGLDYNAAYSSLIAALVELH